MLAPGSPTQFLFSLLFGLFHSNPSAGFSLKSCTIAYSENPNYVGVACKGRDITAIPDDIPLNATTLDLSSNQLVRIKQKDLGGLSKLYSVMTQFNSISHIDDGAFADLAEVRVFNIDENLLTNLTDNIFRGLSKLILLTLYNNKISSISPLAFESLVSIQIINLGSNHLHQITDVIPMLKIPTLSQLFVGYNKLTSFQSDDLPVNVSNIQLLMLGMNPLRRFSLRRDMFPHLQSLDLSKCTTDIEWDVANKTFLRNLTALAFSGTDVSFETYRAVLQTTEALQTLSLYFIKSWINKGLVGIACQIPSLRVLEVTVCDIGSVDDNLLRSCSQLTELNLNSNTLTELSERSLSSMTQLRVLSLAMNLLTRLPPAARGLSSLENLDLSYNFITELNCEDLQNLTGLTTLKLNHNRMSNLQGCVFQNLNNLKTLDLEQNDLFTVDSTFKVNLHKLESLNLHSNALVNLMQGSFSKLSALTDLNLESNDYFPVYDGAFEGLSNLQTLTLTLDAYRHGIFKGLTQLKYLTLHLTFNWEPKSSQENAEPPFSNLPNLWKLTINVYDDCVTTIRPNLLEGLASLEYLMTKKFLVKSLHPQMFKHTPRLKGLQISHSGLTNLSLELFRPIPNLKYLDLSNNNLKSLDFLAALPRLRWLQLGDNMLSIINETVLESLPDLTYLNLTSNPLTCECSNAGFTQWVQSSKETQVINGYQYVCAFPVSQQGSRLLDFDVDSCRMYIDFLCFIISTCLVSFTLVTSFIYHFLRWHLAYAYYLFLAFIYDKGQKRKGTPYCYDAFVSYNTHDEAWVYEQMLPVLEGDQGWRLCLHHRDFEPGKPIVENITDAIYGSRKTICVISQHYLQSEWCSKEIQMASFRLFDEQEDVLILVFVEDIPAHQLTPYYQMRRLVKSHSYLSWSHAAQHTGVFWQNIRRALGPPESPTENTHLLSGRPNYYM
ncbi:uncharacterized protein V6R79_014465 [Siganus canaliculatus]